MFSRAAARILPRANLSARTTSVRAISSTARVCEETHHTVPKVFGPGSKPGEIPSIMDQATGLERLQLLGDIQGVEVFDRQPLDASRIGTKKEPIMVASLVS
jgi:cytochrome c oxidase subunit 5b